MGRKGKVLVIGLIFLTIFLVNVPFLEAAKTCTKTCTREGISVTASATHERAGSNCDCTNSCGYSCVEQNSKVEIHAQACVHAFGHDYCDDQYGYVECTQGKKCNQGECTCVIQWVGDDSGSIPTSETSKTKQAASEAYQGIFQGDPVPTYDSSTNCWLGSDAEIGCTVCIDGTWEYYADYERGTAEGSGTWSASCENFEICNNGIDDDGNGLIDCADSACAGQTGSAGESCEPAGETTCDDGYDNDVDSLVDMDDPNCAENEGGCKHYYGNNAYQSAVSGNECCGDDSETDNGYVSSDKKWLCVNNTAGDWEWLNASDKPGVIYSIDPIKHDEKESYSKISIFDKISNFIKKNLFDETPIHYGEER